MTEKSFVHKLKKLLEKDGYFVKPELGVGFGVADLVLIKNNQFNKNHCLLRKQHSQKFKLLNEDYFRVLQCLPDQEKNTLVHFDEILNKSKLSKSLLKYKILKDLEDKKYIKCVHKNYYFKVNGWLPIAKEVVAIEAKIKDWKRGVYQANRYKAFADKVYLAIPKETEHLVDKSILAKYGVGLIVLDNKKVEKMIKISAPKNVASNENKKNYAMEHFWDSSILKQLAIV